MANKLLLFLLPIIATTAAIAQSRQNIGLDGPWQIVFDRQNEGRPKKWHMQKTFESLDGSRTIVVPSCWETIEQDYEGTAWYGRRATIPREWKDRLVRLRFGAVNYRAEVWVNDQPAGFHEGGYTPFDLTVGDFLKPGEDNFIAVRVLGPVITKDTYLDNIGPNETPHWRGAITGGIWQSASLTATSEVYLAGVFIAPDIHKREAAVKATVFNGARKSGAATIEFGIAGQAGRVRRQVILRPGANVIDAEVPIQKVELWSPDNPHLYTLQTAVQSGGRQVDAVDERFGMREFVLRGDSYYLNGRKTFIKAGFWEGFYPGTLAFPADEQLVRREIRLAKEAGFNVLRPWRKPPVPMILALADEMGMMIIGAPPIECMDYWPQLAPETEHRIAGEIREMILRDRNHPSVIYWELFNEVVRPGIGRLKHPMSVLARDLDPTRIVVDESGGWADGAHAYPPDGYDPEPINELHSYLPAPVEPRTYELYRHVGQHGFDPRGVGKSQVRAPDGLVFVSEVGYGGLPDLPANFDRYKREGNPLTPDYRYTGRLLEGITRAMHAMRWQDLFPDVGALCRASQRVQAEGNRLQLEALRLNPRVGGYCLHAYTDGNWVIGAGVLDLFREPKLVYDAVKRVQAPVYVALRTEPANVREGVPARLLLESVNESDAARGTLQLEIAAPGGKIVHREEHETSIAPGIGKILETSVPALSQSGIHKIRVRLRTTGGAEYVNEHEFTYITNKDLTPPPAFAIFDPGGELAPFLKARGLRASEFSARNTLPVIVTAATARDADHLRAFRSLIDFVERGGTAVFLRPPATRTGRQGQPPPKGQEHPLIRSGTFPLQLQLRPARGLWVPVNHGVRPHPVFEGLPAGDFMGQSYLNVCATETLLGTTAPPIVGSLSYSWGKTPSERNYLGPGDVWWGADLTEVTYGKGRMVLSTLRLIENLERDPVAEKLFYNLVRWAEGAAGQGPAATAAVAP